MAESWTERARRRERDRKRREAERRRRQLQRMLDPAQYAKMGRRAVKKALRRATAAQRRRIKREIRKRKYRAQKRMFGACPTCGRANGPSHTCNMRAGQHNAARLRRRMEKRGTEENPNLWKGRRAA